jgi:predicted DNA-binding transcriptional regulator YafY
MARYDQTTRQLFLLARIESSRFGVTLQELVDSIPDDYPRNPRTVRRDLEAMELHYPVYATRQNGRTVWKLVEGYQSVPQLRFSQTELMALVFSRDLLKPLDGIVRCGHARVGRLDFEFRGGRAGYIAGSASRQSHHRSQKNLFSPE